MSGSQADTSAPHPPHPQKKNTKKALIFSSKMNNFAGE